MSSREGIIAALCALTLSACGLQPARAPRSEVFSQLAPVSVHMPAPAELPPRPQAQVLATDGGDYMAFDAEQAARLLARDEAAAANTDIAGQCTAGYNELAGAYGDLLERAQQHEAAYNQLAQRWADAENDAQRERVIHDAENWINRALLLLALGLAL